jgi:TP901 family phage tail tape measure protein
MPEDMSKDVVGARINIDTSKIMPAFEVINKGAKQNAANFKILNTELAITERHYKTLTTAMDKMALTSSERRNKILSESDALVKQRTSQTQLTMARANQYKGQEVALQASLARKYQLIAQGNRRMEMAEERHQAMMARGGDSNVLGRSSQYLVAGSLFYAAVRGATEAIAVLKDFEYTLVNIKRVMGNTADVEFVKQSMISDAKEYGFALKEVGEVYTQIAQQGFNEKETAALARTALMAANVEQSFTGAAQAQELMTGAIQNLGLAAQDSERLLDKLNQVSNDYSTDSNKLLEGINRTGAAAKNAGVPVNTLIGYLTALNKAGATGAMAGNAIKSFISFSTRDIAIDKLEKYVGEIKKASGEMMPFNELLDRISEQWLTLADSQRHEITQAIARGDQASKFISLMDNYAMAVDAAATAENSFGSAQRENALAMTTLEKQSKQLKAAWDELIVSIGDAGLLRILKAIVHEQTLLVDGFNSLNPFMRHSLTVVLGLGAAFLVLNTGMRLVAGQSLVSLIAGLYNGTRAMMGLKVATDAATVSQKAFSLTGVGAVLAAISVLLGIATIAWTRHKGVQEEARETMQQTDRDAMELGNRYKELKSIIDDNTKSSDEITTAQGELAVVVDKLSGLMPNLISQWDAHGKVIDINIGKLTEFMDKNREAIRIVETSNIKQYDARRDELEIENKIKKSSQYSEIELSNFEKYILGKDKDEEFQKRQDKLNRELLDNEREMAELEAKRKNSQDTLDLLNGKTKTVPKDEKNHGGLTKTDEEKAEEYKLRKEGFDTRMSEFRHLVNIEKDGYVNATDQLKELEAVRKEFGDLDTSDLYGIDEDIHRTKTGNKVKAKGIGAPKVGKTAFEKAEDIITHQKAMGQLTEEMELSAWTNLRSMVASGSDLAMKADEKIYQSKLALKEKEKELLQNTYDFSNGWLAHQRAIGKLSEKDEYEAAKRIQARYLEGTELRKKADEDVYAAKQALMKSEEQELDKFVKGEQDRLQGAKKSALDKIQSDRDAYVDAQDEKIKALDRLMAAEDIANEDVDYAKNLAEKQARLGVLASAVGPEGIKEREDLLKEIEQMKVEHNRVIRRRDLEAQKLALEDDKQAKEKEFDEQTKAVETHYETLLSAFDSFSNDAEGRAETLKQLQILKDSEKNAEILKNLDAFIGEYNRKVSSIGSLSMTQAEIDFEKYKANQAMWNDPKATQAQKQAANTENVGLRDKYGVSQTDYLGLQHFKDGGRVQGRRGQAVPVVAHGGEMYINEIQQSNLFKLLNFTMPQLNFSIPGSSVGGGSSGSVHNHYYNFDNSIGSVALDGNGVSALYDQRTGIITRQQSFGKKQR